MQISKESLIATMNPDSYDIIIKILFLGVFILQTTGIMFPELAKSAVAGSMEITLIAFSTILLAMAWGALCLGISKTKIGMWTFRGK